VLEDGFHLFPSNTRPKQPVRVTLLIVLPSRISEARAGQAIAAVGPNLTASCRHLSFTECVRWTNSSSTLNGKRSQVARRREGRPLLRPGARRSFRGAWTPNPSAIDTANTSRRSRLNNAVTRVYQPTSRRIPKRSSAPVAMTPGAGIIAAWHIPIERVRVFQEA
jgi:hypothetical protein